MGRTDAVAMTPPVRKTMSTSLVAEVRERTVKWA